MALQELTYRDALRKALADAMTALAESPPDRWCWSAIRWAPPPPFTPPAGCGPRIGAEFVHGMAAAETTGEVSHLLRLLGPRGGQLSDAALAAMAREMGRGCLRTLATALATADGRQRIDLLRPLADLAERIPVRAVFGLDDRIVSATDALNLPPRVAAHFLPAGHMPQWDAPREVAALIDEETQHG